MSKDKDFISRDRKLKSMPVWNQKDLRAEFSKTYADLLGQIERSDQVGNPSYCEGTTTNLSLQYAARGVAIKISHYSERQRGHFTDKGLEQFVLKADGSLTMTTEIHSDNFEGVVSWRRDMPTSGALDELSQIGVKRARKIIANLNTKGGE